MAQQRSEATIKLGDALRRARGQQVSQEDVASAALINVRNYGAYERGETEMGVHMLVRLAAVLGTTPARLLDDAGISVGDVPESEGLETAISAREARLSRRRSRRTAR